MFKSIKNKRFIQLFVKIILFALVLYFLYLQVQKLDFEKIKSIHISNYFYFCLAILLLFVNYSFEALKWFQVVETIEVKVNFKTKIKSFLAGILTGFLTPNLLGNFIGRMYYFERRERIKIIYLTFFSNAAQFFASIIFGLISLILIGFPKDFDLSPGFILTLLLLFAILFCLTFFLNLHKVFSFFFKKRKWFLNVKKIFRVENKFNIFTFQLKQLILSFLRHFVFSLQYFLILVSFGIKADFDLILLIWQLFFWSTLIPSLWLGKLFIRESIALWILASYTNQLEIVLISSILIWLVNQGFTALIALPYLKFSNNK